MENNLRKWFHTAPIIGIVTVSFPSVVIVATLASYGYIIALSTLMYRSPNPDTVLIVETPKGTFSTKSLLQNKRHMGARLISTSRLKLEEPAPEDTEEVDPFSAARCRIYKRTKKVCTKRLLRPKFFFFGMHVCKRGE